MACQGALTSIVMTAAASFVANGSVPGLGGPAIGSAAGAPTKSIFDSISGSSFFEGASSTIQNAVGQINQGWFTDLTSTLGSMQSSAFDFTATMKTAWNTMATSTGNDIFSATVGTFGKPLADTLQSITTNSFSTALNTAVNYASSSLGGTGNLIGSVIQGDPKVYGGILSSAQGFIDQANGFINASSNGGNILDATFTKMDNLITGGFNGVTQWAEGFGSDLAKLGSTINFDNLKALGSPGQLLANLDIQGTLGPMYDKVSNIQVDFATASKLGSNITPAVFQSLAKNGTVSVADLGIDINSLARQGASLPSTFQNQIFGTLNTLNAPELNQVKNLLNNTQTAVKTGQDLLNPQKLFASSFQTLTAPIKTASVGYRAIYVNDSGSVNPELNRLGKPLEEILPPDLAVTNAALSRSLQQVKNIQNSNSDILSEALGSLETLKDLPLLQNQTTPVIPEVAEYWQQYYTVDPSTNIQLATGNTNNFVLSDIIGWSAGYNSNLPMVQNNYLLNKLNNEGAFDAFTQSQGIYETIQTFCSGVWTVEDPMSPGSWTTTIPAGWVGAGIYGPAASAEETFEDAWINGIIPEVIAANEAIAASYADAMIVIANEDTYQEQYYRELANQAKFGLDITDVPSSDQQALNMAQNLHSYGRDPTAGGVGELLERVVNFDTLGGQSTIAGMREGRNIARLEAANIQQDMPLNTQGLQPPGSTTSSRYTKQEAIDNIITS